MQVPLQTLVKTLRALRRGVPPTELMEPKLFHLGTFPSPTSTSPYAKLERELTSQELTHRRSLYSKPTPRPLFDDEHNWTNKEQFDVDPYASFPKRIDDGYPENIALMDKEETWNHRESEFERLYNFFREGSTIPDKEAARLARGGQNTKMLAALKVISKYAAERDADYLDKVGQRSFEQAFLRNDPGNY